MRVVVVLTLSTFCERFDYDPGGLGGVCKLFPHIMVMTNVPIHQIDATVRLDRPEKTTSLDNAASSSAPKSCCSERHDRAHENINTLLTTDYNDNPSFAPTPFWGNIFSYHQTRAFDALGDQPFQAVRADATSEREDPTLVERDLAMAFQWKPEKRLRKLPRQGEFDNIHLAPPLALSNVTHLAFGVGGPEQLIPIDDAVRSTLRIDEISMAPICAHDCFHLHWRWTTDPCAKWSLGWDAQGPYRVPGAPMVPLDQNVYVRLRSAHEMSYLVRIRSVDGGEDRLEPGEWHVMFHHGAGYPSSVTRALGFLVTLAAAVFGDSTEFFDLAGIASPTREDMAKQAIGPGESKALFYWKIRFNTFAWADGSIVVQERIRVTPENLVNARRL